MVRWRDAAVCAARVPALAAWQRGRGDGDARRRDATCIATRRAAALRGADGCGPRRPGPSQDSRSQDAMLSEGIARVRALAYKARALGSDKGHVLRAAERSGRAVEAARNLVPGPDNLTAVDMQLSQASALYIYSLLSGGGSALTACTRNTCLVITTTSNSVDAHRAECIALFSAAVAALERRRVVGALLDSELAEALASARVHDPDAEASHWSIKLEGYEVFLHAAKFVLCILVNSALYAAECSAAQFQSFAQHVVHAMELMQQPRRHGKSTMPSEVEFVEIWLRVVDELAYGGLNLHLVQQLTDAWQRLRRSGVLEARGLLNERELLKVRTSSEKDFATVRTAITSPGLRSCALLDCGVKEAHPQHFKQCAACKTVVYCSREHQLADWPAHKAACKAARKAAKPSGGGGSSTAS